MTNERRYQLLTEMIKAYGTATDTADGAAAVIKDPNTYVGASWLPFYQDAAQMLQECREKMDTAPRSILPAAKRIIRNADRCNKPMAGVINHPNGEHYLCDGYRITHLFNDIESLPHVDCLHEFQRMIDETRARNAGNVFPAPTTADIKAAIAEAKATKNTLGGSRPMLLLDYIGVNPQYLLDAIETTGATEMHMPEVNNQPIYMKGEHGEAVVLPVNIGERRTLNRAAA